MQQRRALWIAALLVTLAVLRIVPTYRTFSATTDEATHVGAGLELIQFHRYRLQQVNPPLPRIVLALAPALGGMRFDPTGNYGEQLRSVFFGRGKYERNLFLSRIGNIVFLALAAIALFFWARREIDSTAAVIAVFLFTFQPVILGHSGLATNDIAATAAMAVALLAFSRWLEKPSVGRAAIIGLGYSFAVLCKFSSIAYVPLVCAGILAVRLVRDRDRRRTLIRCAATLLVILVITPLTIWAGYAFTVGHFTDIADVKQYFGPHFEHFITAHPTAPLPAPSFFWGVGDVLGMDQGGWNSYLFGARSRDGFPMYFPATIALKTPLPFLLLFFVGAFFAWRTASLRWIMVESTVAAALILGLAMRSRLDLGIRYILPIFVPFTMATTAGAVAMLRSSRAMMRVGVVLLASYAVVSAAAHPDYFPYFNALAGRDPSLYLVDSNLDWGQDLLRLRSELRRSHVDRIGVLLMGGVVDYRSLEFPPDYPVDPFTPATGWIAISDHVYSMDATRGGWRWLSGHSFRRVGKSIRLYHLP